MVDPATTSFLSVTTTVAAKESVITIRDYRPQDAEVVNEITRLAWEQFRDHFPDFNTFIAESSKMSTLTETCELLLAKMDDKIVGVVGYGPPHRPKQPCFNPAWAVIRMLSTHPEARGHGVGRLLIGECIRRAERDRAAVLALTTTTINEVALKMYLRMGFRFESDAPPVASTPAGLYLMLLKENR